MGKNSGRGRGKARRRYLKGNINVQLTIGTLADNTSVSTPVGDTVNERTLISSVVANYGLRDQTPTEGPLVVGIAHSDYTTAEIEEYLENSGSWNEGDLVNQEIAKRKIRQIGEFPGNATEEILNDGRPVKTKCNWILTQGQTIDVWVFNKSGGALTGGAELMFTGHANLWPTG